MKTTIVFLLGLALGILSAWWRPHPIQLVEMGGLPFVVDNGRVYMAQAGQWIQTYPKP